MNKKSVVMISLAGVALLGTLALTAGTSYAQGPQQGPRGAGGYGQGFGAAGDVQPPTNAGEGYGLQLQQQDRLHDYGDPWVDAIRQRFGGGGRMNQGANPGGAGRGLYAAQVGSVDGALPAAVIDALVAGINDEYHAYATYQAVIDQFGPVAPFVRIQQAEAAHIAALARAFARYGLAVPAAPPLAATPGFASIEDACAAGVAAETANLALYDAWLETVSDYPDLVRVFTALRDASEFNHLPAFQTCAG